MTDAPKTGPKDSGKKKGLDGNKPKTETPKVKVPEAPKPSTGG